MNNPYGPLSPLKENDTSKALATHFLLSLQHPQKTQAETLRCILQEAAHSDIGKRYSFSKIDSVLQFQNTLPLTTWQNYEPLVRRMANGEENLLFCGKPIQFLQTSGSLGQNKWIPVSSVASQKTKLVNRLRTYFRRQAVLQAGLMSKRDALENDRVFLFPSSAHVGYSSAGIPIGYASGQTMQNSSATEKQMHLCPPFVFLVENAKEREALLLFYALSHPQVVAAMGNNPRRFLALLQQAHMHADAFTKAIESGTLPGFAKSSHPLPQNHTRAAELSALYKQGRFLPRHYWPHFNLACFWLSGPMAPAIEALRPLLPEKALFFDAGYGASELKINIPLTAHTAFAPPALFAGFFEFLPQNGSKPLLVHELQEGQVYELVITTYAGLYRYRLGDYIKVHGKTGQTPHISFYARVSEEANLSGESVNSALLLQAAKEACAAFSLTLLGFATWPRADKGLYECYVELLEEQTLPVQWAATFDERLQHLTKGYQRRRNDGSLSPPRATQMRNGWENTRLLALANSQAKTPLILKKAVEKQFHLH